MKKRARKILIAGQPVRFEVAERLAAATRPESPDRMRWLAWLRGVDLPPWGRALPPIEVLYFSCTRCGSLSGGVSGKGPWKSLRSQQASRCRHEWSARSLEAFRTEATARFDVDWSREGAWWSRGTTGGSAG